MSTACLSRARRRRSHRTLSPRLGFEGNDRRRSRAIMNTSRAAFKNSVVNSSSAAIAARSRRSRSMANCSRRFARPRWIASSLRASGVMLLRRGDDASMASRRRQSRSTRPRESLVLAPRRCRYHDCHKPWRTLRNAPPDVRDAARADRRAEDRITAGERVGERPQGFASRLRRARRAVLQEACSLAPVCFSRRVASTSTSSTRSARRAFAESSRRPPRHR